MKRYIVIFEQNSTRAIHQMIVNEIKQSSGWAALSDNAFIIDTDEDLTQIRDRINNRMDGGRLFVCLLQREAAWVGLSNEVSNWIKNNL